MADGSDIRDMSLPETARGDRRRRGGRGRGPARGSRPTRGHADADARLSRRRPAVGRVGRGVLPRRRAHRGLDGSPQGETHPRLRPQRRRDNLGTDRPNADDDSTRVLAGVLSATGVTDPGESVIQTFRFSELTLVVTSERLVKHVGSAVWDEEFEEFAYADITDLDFEGGPLQPRSC